MNTILVCLGYNYVVVTPEILGKLAECKSYTRDWDGSKYTYLPNTESTFTNIEVIADKDLEPDLVQLNNESILEENNRLTRVNELLQAELDRLKGKSNSTELVVN